VKLETMRMIRSVLKTSAHAVAAAMLFSSLPLSSAEAQYYYPRPRNDAGAAIAGGVLGGLVGGLAAGAIVNSGRPNVYYPPVAAPAPVYVQPEPVYEYVPSCRMERRTVWLDQYTYTHRSVRVCE
jgi:hypothetical protein